MKGPTHTSTRDHFPAPRQGQSRDPASDCSLYPHRFVPLHLKGMSSARTAAMATSASNAFNRLPQDHFISASFSARCCLSSSSSLDGHANHLLVVLQSKLGKSHGHVGTERYGGQDDVLVISVCIRGEPWNGVLQPGLLHLVGCVPLLPRLLPLPVGAGKTLSFLP